MDKSTALGALSALSQETRLDVFRLLVQAGANGLSAGEVAERLGVRQNTMSSHLGILAQGRLVHRQRQGKNVRYRADYDAMRELVLFLLEDCCEGNPAVCAPLLEAIAC